MVLDFQFNMCFSIPLVFQYQKSVSYNADTS